MAMAIICQSFLVCVSLYCVVWCVAYLQLTMARTFRSAGKLKEAENISRHVFDVGLRAQGPRGETVTLALGFLHTVLTEQGRARDARELKSKAAKLGCDVTVCAA